jgi:type III pantothenate kinase
MAADKKLKVFVIDIGNTFIHFGVVDTASLRCSSLKNLPHSSYRNAIASVDTMLRKDRNIGQITIVSVVRILGQTVEAELRKRSSLPVQCVRYHESLPIRFNYMNKKNLGTDRIANCLYAAHINKNGASIIIGAGTAITVDLLVSGIFRGGVILPGPRTQFNSLASSTDALPEIEDQDGKAVFPGTSTAGCMRAGVMYGLAGSLDRIVRKMRIAAKKRCTVFSTGGAWPSMSPYITFSTDHVPDLTLIGAALFRK